MSVSGPQSLHLMQQPSSPYLPNYLLGERSSQTTPQGLSSHPMLPKSTERKRLGSLRASPYTPQRISPKDRSGAPPVESLYAVKTSLMDVSPSNPKTPGRSSASDMNTSVFSPREDIIPPSPAQIDPFYQESNTITSEDILDDRAVTVFGFPPAASSYILGQFRQYGMIEKYEIHNTGNWMHIQYQTKIQTKKALSKNGKIFAKNIMIGVAPCIKKEIASMESSAEAGTPLKSPLENPLLNKFGTPGTPKQRPSGIRSLAATPLKPTSEVLAPEKGTPKKSDSVVGKALEYVLGW